MTGAWYGLLLPTRRDQESSRIQQLTTAATSDNALYAALAAEASRLRLHQLLGFIAFVCTSTLLVVVTVRQLSSVAQLTTTLRVLTVILVILLVSAAVFRYASGLDNGSRARRLDIALRAVHGNRALPIMD
jgi:hypothetical protein